MKRWREYVSYLVVALVASGLTLYITASRNPQSKLDQLERLITARFIGEADSNSMEDAAAAAMVDSLGDRWSYYIPAAEYEAYQEQMTNSYVGIGVTIQREEQGERIEKVTPEGPGWQAGLLPGDLLTAVDDTPIAGLTAAEVRNLVRGEEGTFVKITVERDDRMLDFSVERRQIHTPVATGTLLRNGIGLVTIANFDARCAEESIAAIESLLGQGAQKLIFDVRGNPGGYKDELVKLLDYLLPEGILFRSEDYAGHTEQDRSDDACLDVPMAVLVNGDSYSAAEFFAAALSEYEAAVIVGEKTCGKGYFQVTYRLNDGSAVGLSVGKYMTPKGVSLAGVGITPDVQLALTQQQLTGLYAGTLKPMEDPQILAAMEVLEKP